MAKERVKISQPRGASCETVAAKQSDEQDETAVRQIEIGAKECFTVICIARYVAEPRSGGSENQAPAQASLHRLFDCDSRQRHTEHDDALPHTSEDRWTPDTRPLLPQDERHLRRFSESRRRPMSVTMIPLREREIAALELVSPELVLVDPELAEAARASLEIRRLPFDTAGLGQATVDFRALDASASSAIEQP